jgi:glutamyl-tRNA reductase
MGAGVATALARAGAGGVVVANRSLERGEALADRVGARLVGMDDLGAELALADVVVSCTGAGTFVVTGAAVAAARGRSGAPLLVVDIALPRDVEPAVADIPGVVLRDLDDLKTWANRGLEKRSAEVSQVRSIVGEEIERFVLEQAQRQASPLIAQLREAVESIRVSEIERMSGRTAGFDEDQLAVVDAITRGIVAKLLHNPSVRLREAAGTPQGERLAAAVRDLFDLH